MSAPRFSIRLDGVTILPVTLPLDRAERVARRAVSAVGRFDTAEVLDEVDGVLLSFARVAGSENQRLTSTNG